MKTLLVLDLLALCIVVIVEGLAPLGFLMSLCEIAGEVLTVVFSPVVIALLTSLIAVIVGWGVWTMVDTRRLVRRLQPLVTSMPPQVQALCSELGIDRRCHVVDSHSCLAMSVGLWKPKIFVSSGLLSRLSLEEIEAVLRHEANHLLHRDPLTAAAGRILQRGLFFVPAINQVLEVSSSRREIRADKAAIAGMGTPYPLASALLKALAWPDKPVHGAANAFSAVDARIDHLLVAGNQSTKERQMVPTIWRHIALAFTVGVGVCAWIAEQSGSNIGALLCTSC